jgi:cyclopropane fatty-acyl-phospholipid synthase-like methyltransferase
MTISNEANRSGNLNHFEKFNLWQLLKGSLIYKYKAFYEAKEILMKYDEDTDYVNYGYWPDGEETKNPSRTLVLRLVSNLNLKSDDILLNVGSGMGQPDVDIINNFSPAKIIGINIVAEQIEYANRKFRLLELDHQVEHRLIHSDDIVTALSEEGITAVVSVEAIVEIASVDKFIKNAYRILPPGGRICFCDEMEIESNKNIFKKLPGSFLMKVTSILYGDNWRTVDSYKTLLKANGFTKINYESIGANVYSPLYRHARKNFSRLKEKNIPFILRIFAYFNLYGLNLLFKWGQIDYGIFCAEKD